MWDPCLEGGEGRGGGKGSRGRKRRGWEKGSRGRN